MDNNRVLNEEILSFIIFESQVQPVAEHIDYKLLYEQQKATIEEQQFQISALTLQLQKFKKMIFGSKNERFVATDDN